MRSCNDAARTRGNASHGSLAYRPMRLHPNPPRLITVGIAVACLVVGAILALPIEPAMALLDPVRDFAGGYGLALDREMGYLLLFVGDVLLVAGSLLPGI